VREEYRNLVSGLKKAKFGVISMKDQQKEKIKDLSLPLEGFARPAQVARAFGVSVPTLYNWIKDGRLPKPEKDGTRVTRWPVAVIREYLARQGGTVFALSDRQGNQPTPAS
jgi:predicted DNA-binding transcriptional regulator AlpA